MHSLIQEIVIRCPHVTGRKLNTRVKSRVLTESHTVGGGGKTLTDSKENGNVIVNCG